MSPVVELSVDGRQGQIKVVWGPWLKLRKGPFLYI